MLDYAGERQKGEGRSWTERHMVWSPRGTYLVTFHPRGLILWAGNKFHEVLRIPHVEAQEVVFSPDERYAATWASAYGNANPAASFIGTQVWDVRTGQELRSFKQPRGEAEEHCTFVWSADSKYVARVAATPPPAAS
jgi:translation initiation factor 3 subunit B